MCQEECNEKLDASWNDVQSRKMWESPPQKNLTDIQLIYSPKAELKVAKKFKIKLSSSNPIKQKS